MRLFNMSFYFKWNQQNNDSFQEERAIKTHYNEIPINWSITGSGTQDGSGFTTSLQKNKYSYRRNGYINKQKKNTTSPSCLSSWGMIRRLCLECIHLYLTSFNVMYKFELSYSFCDGNQSKHDFVVRVQGWVYRPETAPTKPPMIAPPMKALTDSIAPVVVVGSQYDAI